MTREEFLHKWHDLGDLPVGEEQEFVADLDALLASERERCIKVAIAIAMESHWKAKGYGGNSKGFQEASYGDGANAVAEEIRQLGPTKGEKNG